MQKNDLVRCLDTHRVGVVLDLRRGGVAMMVLVKWPESTHWVDAVDLEPIDTSS